MTDGTIYAAGWTLDDVQWSKFDRSKVTPSLLAAIKAASLVECNAAAYVAYLQRVLREAGPQTLTDMEKWGREEVQHGEALGRWAEMADPSFNFKAALARFQKGYVPQHFQSADAVSVRGSRRGEMIARCVVESGTSSFYSAIRDGTDEPLLKEIAGRIAADEFRHYKLFFETLHAQDEPEMSFLRRLKIAVGRVSEAEDDELSYAYYAANIPPEMEASHPYRRAEYSKLAAAEAVTLYRQHHIKKLVQMVAKAVGANPQGRMASWAGSLLWQIMRLRASFARRSAPLPA
jgi:hypothetical protein